MEITLYTKDDLVRLDLIKANELLKERGYFHVWLSFVDPRTDCLVQDYFCFYPKPQPSYAGGLLPGNQTARSARCQIHGAYAKG
jgi:hypothetical protein